MVISAQAIRGSESSVPLVFTASGTLFVRANVISCDYLVVAGGGGGGTSPNSGGAGGAGGYRVGAGVPISAGSYPITVGAGGGGATQGGSSIFPAISR
ncbi:hypothetical protein EBU95_22010 [bacterium]|nr:hypothetical protein [bacterium]